VHAVVTGMGAVTALGRGVARQWSAIAAGEDGIRPIERFSTDGFDVRLGGVVADRNCAGAGDAALCIELGIDAAREAWAAAGLAGVPAERIALVVGSSLGDERVPLHEVTCAIGDAVGARGPRLTVSTACTSSTNALGLALDLLEQGAADAVIAGGTDVLTPLVHAGFHALGVLSIGKCAPFSQPAGTTLGEGAGFVVLERRADARRRGARSDRAVLGYGLSADGYHETGPDPSGGGVARALRGALAHAGVGADAIGYVNAHGTGTTAGDPAEWRALRQVLGERAAHVPVSASKSFFGHAQGAAGVVEVIATLVALDHDAIPPTRNFAGPRPHAPADPVAQDRPRPHVYDLALCNNSGFGGANCALVVGRTPAVELAAAPPRPIYVIGAGAVGPHGTSAEALLAALTETPPASDAPRLDAIAPAIHLRGADPSMRYLVAAASLALADARLRVRGPARERTGLIVGMNHVSPDSHDALQRTIDERGLRHLSATMFARMVLNATTGVCSKALELKGPCSTVSAAGASGLAAVAYAAHLLARRGDADHMVAGAVEEAGRALGPGVGEGAACVVLAAAPPPGPRVRVAGWAVAGPRAPGGPDGAVQAALAMAGCAPRDLDLGVGPRIAALELPRWIAPTERLGDAGAATSGFGLAAAAVLVRGGAARRALVVAEPSESATCAIVLTQEGAEHA